MKYEKWYLCSCLILLSLCIMVMVDLNLFIQDCLLILLGDGRFTAKINLSNYKPFGPSWKQLTLWKIVVFFDLGSTLLTILL